MRKHSVHAVVIGAFILLTILLTYPLIFHLTTHIPYHKYLDPSGGDQWVFLWALGFVEHRLAETQQWPFYTTMLFYPRGVDLTYPLLLGVGLPLLVALPLVQVLGIVPTYNLFLLGAFVATGYATFLLVRSLTQDSRAAFVAGVIFAFCPYQMMRAVAHFNLATSGMWIPLYILLFLKAVHGGSVKYVVVTPLVLALTFASNPYYAVFLGCFTALYLIYHFISRRDSILNNTLLRRLGFMGGLGAFLFLPAAWLLLTHSDQESMLYLPLAESSRWSADLLAFFVPSTHHTLWGSFVRPLYTIFYTAFEGNDTEQTVYIGYMVLTLAVVGLIKTKAETRFWLVMALAFFVLALGPFLRIYGRDTLTLSGVPLSLPMPNMVLHIIPGFNAVRGSSRFSVMLMLAMAVIAAYGTKQLLQRLDRRTGAALLGLGLIVAVIAGEFLTAPVRLVDARIPQIYERIGKTQETRGTLLDVPLRWSLMQYEYYQTAHHQRLLLGQAPRISIDLLTTYGDSVPFMKLFKNPDLIQDYDQAPVNPREVLKFIEFFDVSWIVFHKDQMWPEIFERLRRFVLANFPIAQVEEEGDIVALRLARNAYDVADLAEPEGFVLDFGSTTPQFFVADGWSYPEQWGELTVAWSNAKESRVWVPFPQVKDFIMELRLLPVKLPEHPLQTVRIYLNERFLGEIDLDASGWGSYTLPLPGISLLPGINTFRFAYRYTKSPSNEDSRRLGVAFDFVKFHPE